MRSFGVVVLVLSLSSVACSHNEPISAETLVAPTAAPPPSAAPPPAPPNDEPLPAPRPLVPANDEASAPPLGTACTTGASCGTRGRVSLRAFRERAFAARQEPPCKLTTLASVRDLRGMPEQPRACVAGGRLYVDLACIMCRMPNRTVVEAEVAEMTSQQLADVQKVALLDGAALRTPAAWESAIAEAGKKASVVD